MLFLRLIIETLGAAGIATLFMIYVVLLGG